MNEFICRCVAVRPRLQAVVFFFAGMRTVDIIASDHSANWHIFLNGPSDADEHYNIELAEFALGLRRDD